MSIFTDKDILSFYFLLFLLLFISLAQSLQGIRFTTPLRSFASIPIFVFVLMCTCRWIEIIQKNKYLLFFKICKIFLLIQCALQLVQMILYKLGLFHVSYTYILGFPRCSGLFSEPSHIAYGLSPFLYLFIFHRKVFLSWLGRTGAISLFLTFAFCPSSTLVGVAITLLFFFAIRSCNSIKSFVKLLIPFFLISVIIITAILNIPATSDRFFDVINLIFYPTDATAGENLSALLFLKGMQMAFAALQHYPLGSGFLNFQFLNDYSSISMLSDLLYRMNIYEGTSVGFKLIGEYGYIGLTFIAYLFYIFFKNIRKKSLYSIFQNFICFGMIIGCIRGSSYFDGFPVITFAIIFIHLFKRSNINQNMLFITLPYDELSSTLPYDKLSSTKT